MTYLDACLKEAMRLQPPSPSNLQRLSPSQPTFINGQLLPAGTKVRFSNWSLQRDLRYFGQPDQFLPQRWLNDESDLQSKILPHNPKAFFAFMIGPGTCVAKNLAMIEMRLVNPLRSHSWYWVVVVLENV